MTQSVYLDEEAKNRVSNLRGDGIQAYFFSRFNTQTNNGVKEEENNTTSNLNSNTQTLNKKKKSDVEFFFYAFYKCFMTIYEKEILQYQIKRREVYKQGNIVKYISFVEKNMSEFRYLEEYILRQVFYELKINDSIESDVKLVDINTKNISTKYYEDLELELPSTLNLEKINEVIVCLFDQTKINLNKIQSLMNLSSSALTDNEYLIAENMAFDYAFQKYNFSETQIRKAVVNYNLSFAIESESN